MLPYTTAPLCYAADILSASPGPLSNACGLAILAVAINLKDTLSHPQAVLKGEYNFD
jgi:hypothetical protein